MRVSPLLGRNVSCCDFKQLFPRLAGAALHGGTGDRLNFRLVQLWGQVKTGTEKGQIYLDLASGKNDDRSGLAVCLKALREGDLLVVWRFDRMGRNLHHLVRTVSMLSERGVGLMVLTGQGAQIDTTTAAGRLSFGIFAALAEFECELIRERTMAGLKAVRARGRKGGRKFALTRAQVRMA